MNKQILVEKLKELGLEEVEASLYFHLLEKGSKTYLQLSRETNINRSKIYRYVERLVGKKLIEESNTAWGRMLKAAPPENLELIIVNEEEDLRRKRFDLPNLVEVLSNLGPSGKTKFEVKHYKGVEGLRQMVWNQLKTKELLLFETLTINDVVGRAFAEKYRVESVKMKQKIYQLSNLPDDFPGYTDIKEFEEKFAGYRYIDKKFLEIKHHIQIYNDVLSIMNWWDGDPVGIEIVNESLADMQRQVFWKFWEIAGEKEKKGGK